MGPLCFCSSPALAVDIPPSTPIRLEPTARRSDALRVAAGVDVLGLERVGEPEQRLIDAALQLLIQRAHVFGVAQRLLIRGVQTAIGGAEIVAAQCG